MVTQTGNHRTLRQALTDHVVCDKQLSRWVKICKAIASDPCLQLSSFFAIIRKGDLPFTCVSKSRQQKRGGGFCSHVLGALFAGSGSCEKGCEYLQHWMRVFLVLLASVDCHLAYSRVLVACKRQTSVFGLEGCRTWGR